MKLPIYQVDAFTNRTFRGNPAAVCPLKSWIKDELMLSIAAENNLSETAFFVPGTDQYQIRWFTPKVEVNLCGHATLASAHVIFNHLDYPKDEIAFQSKSGILKVLRSERLLILDFPASKIESAIITKELTAALGKLPMAVYKSEQKLMALFENEKIISGITPDFEKMKSLDFMGVIATAPGEKTDFVSRFFAPKVGINEDPVTGSAHTVLIPYWADRLGKSELSAMQISERTGYLECKLKNDRVLIGGQAITYLTGEIQIE